MREWRHAKKSKSGSKECENWLLTEEQTKSKKVFKTNEDPLNQNKTPRKASQLKQSKFLPLISVRLNQTMLPNELSLHCWILLLEKNLNLEGFRTWF